MDNFDLWNGEYEKKFYDVKTASGKIYKHCWPNAGKMNATDGTETSWTKSDCILVRISPDSP